MHPLPRRSSRIRRSSASPPSPAPPPPALLTPRKSRPSKQPVVPPVPSTRASRALKRRQPAEQPEDLHSKLDPPRFIKRRKTRLDLLPAQRRPKSNLPSPPVADFGSLTLASDDALTRSPALAFPPSAIVDPTPPRPSVPLKSSPKSDFVLGSSSDLIIDDPYPSSSSSLSSDRSPPIVLDQQQTTTSPALQPFSYSPYPRRPRSPLSFSATVISSPIDHRSLAVSLSRLSYIPSSRPRECRSPYGDGNRGITDIWKFVCIERVEALFAKYGYSNILAAERQKMGNILSLIDRAQFRISTPSNYDDVEMSYDDDDDKDDDYCDIDDFRDDDGMLEIDAEGELDPDHIPSIDATAITTNNDSHPSAFPLLLAEQAAPSFPRHPPLPIPFPPLASIRVPSIVNAVSDDVMIWPVRTKLGKGHRSRQIIKVRGKDIVEWKPEERGGPMGRGTPVDDNRRNDWSMTSQNIPVTWDASWLDPSLIPSSSITPDFTVKHASSSDNSALLVAPTANPTGQDWTSFLDSLARTLNVRVFPTDPSPSFSATLGDMTIPDFPVDTTSPISLSTTLLPLDPAELRQLDHLFGARPSLGSSGLGLGSSLANMANVAATATGISIPGCAASSSTLSRALG